MKTENKFCPVQLELGLEEEACLLTPAQRRALAKKFKRWARQLEVSAFIMERRALPPKPRLSLRAVPQHRSRWN